MMSAWIPPIPLNIQQLSYILFSYCSSFYGMIKIRVPYILSTAVGTNGGINFSPGFGHNKIIPTLKIFSELHVLFQKRFYYSSPYPPSPPHQHSKMKMPSLEIISSFLKLSELSVLFFRFLQVVHCISFKH